MIKTDLLKVKVIVEFELLLPEFLPLGLLTSNSS